MVDAHEAVQSLSPQEAFEIFKALFKDAPFMGTAIPSENQEYTMSAAGMSAAGRVGNTPQTETANLAVVFLDESNEHRDELIDTLEGFYRVTGIKGEDLNRVNPLPSIFREVMTITTNDGETWHLYQGSDGKAPYNHLQWLEQQFARNLFLLTPEGLRKTIANQIFRAQRDLESLRENMCVNNVNKVQKCLEQLAELPDDLLTEDLRALRTVLSSDPDYLNRVKEILQDTQNLISPEALQSTALQTSGQSQGRTSNG
jgi:hypothetical protein